MVSPLGIAGDTILDTVSRNNSIFRAKHCFFVHTLEDEILLAVLRVLFWKDTPHDLCWFCESCSLTLS